MEVRAPQQMAMGVAPAPKYFAYQLRMPPTPHNPTGRPLQEAPGIAQLISYVSNCQSCAIADVAEEVEPGSWCCTCLLACACCCESCIAANSRSRLAAKYGIFIPCVCPALPLLAQSFPTHLSTNSLPLPLHRRENDPYRTGWDIVCSLCKGTCCEGGITGAVLQSLVQIKVEKGQLQGGAK